MAISLTSLPEELLERIIALAVLPASFDPSALAVVAPALTGLPRSSSAPFPSRAPSRPLLPRTSSLQVTPVRKPVNRSTPLLTNTLFSRIGTAVLYMHIHLLSREQCTSLIRTLSARPDLARRVRSLRIEGAWSEVYQLLQCLKNTGSSRLEVFDMQVVASERQNGPPSSTDSHMFCAALAMLPSVGKVKSLTIRKASDAYLTLPGPASILECLSDTVASWLALVSSVLSTLETLFMT